MPKPKEQPVAKSATKVSAALGLPNPSLKPDRSKNLGEYLHPKKKKR